MGIGITPNTSLAKAAGLKTGNGIVVDDFLRTSHPDVYAAGDVAFFPEQVLGPRRIEHWDNAVSQGKHAGRNMAGLNEPFTEMPYFFSDLFEFGYEAVGEVDSRLETFTDWQEPNKTGVIYYLDGARVRAQPSDQGPCWKASGDVPADGSSRRASRGSRPHNRHRPRPPDGDAPAAAR